MTALLRQQTSPMGDEIDAAALKEALTGRSIARVRDPWVAGVRNKGGRTA